MGNEFGSVEALWSQFENFMGQAESEEQGKRKVSEESVAIKKEEGDSGMQ